jgi:GNAT superfamily N-acetyltransferase
MKIVDFDFDPDLLRSFLDFPRRHYAADPNWLPDPGEARLLAPGRGPSSRVIWRNFLAVDSDGERIRGRLTAIVNADLADDTGRPFGQLGFFECIDDQPTAAALAESALAWLRVQAPGACTVLAPMNFDTWHAYRLRTGGFDQPTFAMEPYNPSYYPALLETLGFAPTAAYLTKTVVEPGALLAKWAPYHATALAQGYTFRPLNPAALAEELTLIYRLAIALFHENPFFAGISETEFAALYAGPGTALDPDMLLFALDPAGEPAGFCFTFPDHRHPDTANAKTFGLLPAFRRRGLGSAIGYAVYSRLVAKGFVRINHCLMHEGNSADHFDRGAAPVTRRYALYSRSLDNQSGQVREFPA